MSVAGQRYEPLHTRTKEGLGLHLQVSLQYRLIKEKVGQLYGEFNTQYEQVIISSLRDTLIKAASEYEATQLWTQRAEFGDMMQQMVNATLAKTFATCWGLQLLVIDLPNTFEHSIVLTQVQQQIMQTSEQVQDATRIKAETSVIEAAYAATEKVILAKGNANYTLTTMSARAEARQNKIHVEAEILSSLRFKLGLFDESLVEYQKYSALDELANSSFFFGFEGIGSQMLVPGAGGSIFR